MVNKHYTPELSEFYIGFEYEIKTPSLLEFVESIYSEDDFNEGAFRQGTEFRVKYLDKHDVERTGFIVKESGKHMPVYDCSAPFNDERKMHNKVFFHYNLISKWGLISTGNREYNYKDDTDFNYDKPITRFCGFIKNLSEFRKLLEQLNIK